MATAAATLTCLYAAGGCRHYDRYGIELRDLDSGAPVPDAHVTCRYGMFDEMFRILRWGSPKSQDTTTDADGRAEIRVQRQYAWWFEVEAPSRPMHSASFRVDGTVDESMGATLCPSGWIALGEFGSMKAGSLQMCLTQIKKSR